MKKNSIIFKMICLTVATILCMCAIPAFAEDDNATIVDEEATVETSSEQEETTTVEDEETTDVAQDEDEDGELIEDEVLDLFAATLRDGGVYVTPGTNNAAVFTYNGLRFKVAPGTGNSIKLDGFESNPTIEKDSIAATAKNILQANGEITTSAAHSGYFGLSVSSGKVVYRTGVTGGDIYVFSAWMKMPQSGSISDNDRAFRVVAENGNEYIVGWNEIGRDVEIKDSWQQVLFTFKAPETGLFEIEFNYKGKQTLSIDDLELYEAEIFDNPLDITNVLCIDANGNEYNRSTGFTTAGNLTHTTTLYNSDEDDVFFTAVMVLYKNDIMIDIATIEDCALVLDETEVTFDIEIPEDEDLSAYKYMVYFVNDTQPTQYYGEMPSLQNPYIVQGK